MMRDAIVALEGVSLVGDMGYSQILTAMDPNQGPLSPQYAAPGPASLVAADLALIRRPASAARVDPCQSQ